MNSHILGYNSMLEEIIKEISSNVDSSKFVIKRIFNGPEKDSFGGYVAPSNDEIISERKRKFFKSKKPLLTFYGDGKKEIDIYMNENEFGVNLKELIKPHVTEYIKEYSLDTFKINGIVHLWN